MAKFRCLHTPPQVSGKTSIGSQHFWPTACITELQSHVILRRVMIAKWLTLCPWSAGSPCSRSASCSHLARLTRCRVCGRYPPVFARLFVLAMLLVASVPAFLAFALPCFGSLSIKAVTTFAASGTTLQQASLSVTNLLERACSNHPDKSAVQNQQQSAAVAA